MRPQRSEPDLAHPNGEHPSSPHQDADHLAAPHEDSPNLRDAATRRFGRQPADPVLTRRIAAILAQHQPGWLLPRPSVLARRYHVTSEQVTAAIDELAARHLLRLLPDGKACRISPADYLLELEGQHGLSARVEPLHGQLSCRSKSVAWHPVRPDIESALGIPAGDPVCILQMLWALSGQPAAATTTYLAGPAAENILAEIEVADLASFRTILPMPPAREEVPDGQRDELTDSSGPALIPHALHIEMQQPPPWAAKALRLSACDAAIGITVNYAEPAKGSATALTIAVLRPSEFRVIVDSVVTLAEAAGFGNPPPGRRRATG
jgi:hypothetical protein